MFEPGQEPHLPEDWTFGENSRDFRELSNPNYINCKVVLLHSTPGLKRGKVPPISHLVQEIHLSRSNFSTNLDNTGGYPIAISLVWRKSVDSQIQQAYQIPSFAEYIPGGIPNSNYLARQSKLVSRPFESKRWRGYDWEHFTDPLYFRTLHIGHLSASIQNMILDDLSERGYLSQSMVDYLKHNIGCKPRTAIDQKHITESIANREFSALFFHVKEMHEHARKQNVARDCAVKVTDPHKNTSAVYPFDDEDAAWVATDLLLGSCPKDSKERSEVLECAKSMLNLLNVESSPLYLKAQELLADIQWEHAMAHVTVPGLQSKPKSLDSNDEEEPKRLALKKYLDVLFECYYLVGPYKNYRQIQRLLDKFLSAFNSYCGYQGKDKLSIKFERHPQSLISIIQHIIIAFSKRLYVVKQEADKIPPTKPASVSASLQMENKTHQEALQTPPATSQTPLATESLAAVSVPTAIQSVSSSPHNLPEAMPTPSKEDVEKLESAAVRINGSPTSEARWSYSKAYKNQLYVFSKDPILSQEETKSNEETQVLDHTKQSRPKHRLAKVIFAREQREIKSWNNDLEKALIQRPNGDRGSRLGPTGPYSLLLEFADAHSNTEYQKFLMIKLKKLPPHLFGRNFLTNKLSDPNNHRNAICLEIHSGIFYHIIHLLVKHHFITFGEAKLITSTYDNLNIEKEALCVRKVEVDLTSMMRSSRARRYWGRYVVTKDLSQELETHFKSQNYLGLVKTLQQVHVYSRKKNDDSQTNFENLSLAFDWGNRLLKIGRIPALKAAVRCFEIVANTGSIFSGEALISICQITEILQSKGGDSILETRNEQQIVLRLLVAGIMDDTNHHISGLLNKGLLNYFQQFLSVYTGFPVWAHDALTDKLDDNFARLTFANSRDGDNQYDQTTAFGAKDYWFSVIFTLGELLRDKLECINSAREKTQASANALTSGAKPVAKASVNGKVHTGAALPKRPGAKAQAAIQHRNSEPPRTLTFLAPKPAAKPRGSLAYGSEHVPNSATPSASVSRVTATARSTPRSASTSAVAKQTPKQDRRWK